MKSALLGRFGSGLLLGMLMVAAGCGKALPAVNRVQPNAIAKSTFEGDWYFLSTVIDTPYSAPYTFVGEQGETEKIRWEIQEDYLIARRSYQHIADADGQGVADENFSGAAIAMYAISSHFDIRREYNTVTGEERNVIEENDRDRPWHQREYMRVDWSKNLITETNYLTSARLFDGIEAEPVAYFVQPGMGNSHEPKFIADEDGVMQYMDIVNKMYVRPTTAHIPGFGDIPTCYLNGQSHYDCAPGEITVRHSFRRVDESRDYEPMVYTGDRMERFGYFVTERAGYNNDYGVVEQARFRFVNRHNVWQQSHKRDDSGNLVRCTESTDQVCGGGGSRCDVAFGIARREKATTGEWAGACTIPYRDREIRPIAYYVSDNFPSDIMGDVEAVAHDWNEAFVEMVSSAREVECTQNGGSAADCAAQRNREDHQQIFVLCHNPVTDADPDACGEVGLNPQIGDLRYSMIPWVNEPHAASPLGYGPSSADPETGEIIQANAFIYGAGLETLQSFSRDILALLNNDVTEEQIETGEVVSAWVTHNREPGAAGASESLVGVDGTMENPSEGMDFSWIERFRSEAPEEIRTPGQFVQRFNASLAGLNANGAFGNDHGVGDARLLRLRGGDVERMLMTDEARIAAGVDPNLDPNSAEVLQAASPLRGMSLRARQAVEAAHDQLHRIGQCRIHAAEFQDEGLLGLARAIQRAAANSTTINWYGRDYQVRGEDGSIDYRAVRDMVRHPIFHGVTAHEVGHTVGLRHNFSGSYDSINYKSEYWDLRDNDGPMRPRAWDPITEAEIDGRIKEFQYSTVMDYGHNFVVTDANGLGHYDHAAIKMGYADLVEVFANPVRDVREMAWYNFFRKEWPFTLDINSFQPGAPVRAIPYTRVPELVGSVANLEARRDVPYTSLRTFPELEQSGIDSPEVTAANQVAVPYLFCSDEQAELNPDCYRYDSGADQYETVNSVINSYWDYYVFNAFRRGRIGFDTGAYQDRIYGRFFTKLKYANQIYGLYRGTLTDMFGAERAEAFVNREDGMAPFTLAVQSGFNLLTRVLATPEPGEYASVTRADGTTGLIPRSNGTAAVVNAFDGRPLDSTWNFADGYYWFDQLERVGYFYDKILATMILVDPESHFLGRDTSTDVRRYQISYYSSFGPAMEGLFRALWSDNWPGMGPRVVGGELSYPTAGMLAGQTAMPAGAPVSPATGFSLQLYSTVFALAYIPETFDRSFAQRSRIWIRGAADEVVPTGVPTVEFRDARTGLTYVAISYMQDGREMGPAAQMINHALLLQTRNAAGDLEKYVDNLDIVRRVSWSFDLGN